MTITDATGCVSIHTFKVENLSSSEDTELIKVRLYPNPASDIVTIESDGNIEKILFCSNSGVLIQDIKVISGESTLYNTSLLQSGVYFMTVIIDGKTKTLPLYIIR